MEEFNPAEFIKRPSTILRLVNILFAIVVFGCISSGGYDNDQGYCLYNQDSGACHYGVGIGVIAFLLCIIFLAVDSQYDTINNPENKRVVTLADLAFSGLWTFLWFVGFCYLADKWRQTDSGPISTSQVNNCQAAIAFSFFSVITWCGLSILAFMKYRRGPDEFDYNKDNLEGDSYPSPYAPFPPNTSEAGDPYQSGPFADDSQSENPGPVTNTSEVPSEFKQPTY